MYSTSVPTEVQNQAPTKYTAGKKYQDICETRRVWEIPWAFHRLSLKENKTKL